MELPDWSITRSHDPKAAESPVGFDRGSSLMCEHAWSPPVGFDGWTVFFLDPSLEARKDGQEVFPGDQTGCHCWVRWSMDAQSEENDGECFSRLQRGKSNWYQRLLHMTSCEYHRPGRWSPTQMFGPLDVFFFRDSWLGSLPTCRRTCITSHPLSITGMPSTSPRSSAWPSTSPRSPRRTRA